RMPDSRDVPDRPRGRRPLRGDERARPGPRRPALARGHQGDPRLAAAGGGEPVSSSAGTWSSVIWRNPVEVSGAGLFRSRRIPVVLTGSNVIVVGWFDVVAHCTCWPFTGRQVAPSQ